MVGFNLIDFAQGNQRGGLTQGLVNAFGLPECILMIDEGILLLLPSPILLLINSVLEAFQAEVDAAYQWLTKKLSKLFEIEQYFTEEGLANLRDKLGLTSVVGVLGKMQALINIGIDAYQSITNIINFIEEVKECIEEVISALSKKDATSAAGYTGERIAADLGLAQEQLSQLQDLDERISNLSTKIGDELYERSKDPNRGPKIKREYESILGPTFQYADEEDDEELIRLVYGPPVSKDGQFILSVDGLYYDSQSEDGVFPVLIQLRDRETLLNNADKWKFNFDPNLGGRGEEINERTFNKWLGSIFDLNIIDDSEALEDHYSRDSFLQNLIGQRDKRLLDLKKQVDELTKNGESLAVINNFKQGLVSETNQLTTKIDRRKKQIEIAVKAPTIFGFAEEFLPGTVPINDFSYLQKYNITAALSQQENLIINTESVSGIVKPISAKFVRTKNPNTALAIEPLMIPSVGYDAIITDTSSVYDDSSAATMNLDELIATDGLFALYNFLNSDVVLPDSDKFNLPNCYSYDETNNAQLVAKTSKEFFVDLGLAAPYFKGITEYVNGKPRNLASFSKMPDTKEFQDWTYNKSSGFSFETWIHMPTLEDSTYGWSDNGTSGLYRLILANENTGKGQSITREENYNLVPYENGTNYTKGMIFGFTTDIRWTQGEMPTNDASLQDVSNGYGLLLAPTIAYNDSTVTFIANPVCDATEGWLGMYIPSTKQTASGKTLKNSITEYMLLTLSVDYKSDTITVFLDGEALETSSVVDVFGSPKYQPIQIPSFKKLGSFEYSESNVGAQASTLLKSGPKLGKFFTPWILGGGYTDGNKDGGFMGGEYGGFISGLRGFLGSVKFYNKSIKQDAIQINYNAQKPLFKNISWKYPVVIAMGQSNINAGVVDISGLSPEYLSFDSSTKIWDPFTESGSWQTLNPFVFNNTTRYGQRQGGTLPGQIRNNFAVAKACPLLVFAKNYSKLHKENSAVKSDIYFVKNASDGTWSYYGYGLPSGVDDVENFVYYSIGGGNVQLSSMSWAVTPEDEDWWPADVRDFNYLSGYQLYETLRYDLSSAIENINGPAEVKAVLYMQGENDALWDANFPANSTTVVNGFYFSSLAGERARKWGQSFTKIYNKLQTDIQRFAPNSEPPSWIIGRTQIELPNLGDPSVGGTFSFPYTDEVREQQELIASSIGNVHLVNLDGLTHILESGTLTGIHFDVPGIEQVGLRLFNKFKEVKGFY